MELYLAGFAIHASGVSTHLASCMGLFHWARGFGPGHAIVVFSSGLNPIDGSCVSWIRGVAMDGAGLRVWLARVRPVDTLVISLVVPLIQIASPVYLRDIMNPPSSAVARLDRLFWAALGRGRLILARNRSARA